jgi:uncharacterized lipoprotein YehR (DUF1307 family)
MKLNRILSALLAVIILALLLAGCGNSAPSVSKDFSFKAVGVTTGGTDYQNIISSAFNGNKFIISAYSTDYPEDRSDYDNYVEHNYLIAADKANGIVKKIELSDGYEESYSNFYAAKNGTVYGLKTAGTTHSLITIDEELNISPVLDLGQALADVITDISYISDLKADAAGNIYAWIDRSIYVVNIDSGKYLSTIPTMIGQSNITTLVESPDDKMSALIYGLETTPEGGTAIFNAIAAINPETGMLGTYIPFPAEDNTFAGGDKYPYYTYNSSYIYGVDGETKTIVANLLTSDCAGLEMHDIVYVSDTEFAIRAADMSTHRVGTYMLQKLDPKDVPDKKLVTVAALTTNYFTDYYIKEFNRASSEYQVELKKYATEGLSEADQLAAFNAEFAAGNIPDVLLIDMNMDYRSYASKRMFKDLYPLLDKDPDISRDNLVQSVMNALETDGKLYSVTPHYSLGTFTGKTEIFGEEKGQSLAELQAAAAAIPGAKTLAAYETAGNVITVYSSYSMQDYVNYETGECYFDTPEFISLLEAAKEYPLEIDYATFSFDYIAYLASFTNNEYLLLDQGISDFRNIADFENAYFNAPVTLLGYPDKSGGSGALIFPNDEVAILDDAKNPDGAWEFVKGFMQYKGPENTETATYGKMLSIMQKNMDDFAAEAMEDPYRIDYTTGEKIYSDYQTFLNYNMVTIPNNTVEQNTKVIDLLGSVTRVYRNDEALRQIIADDADAFFRGQKSAEETAKMIENRAETYLAELQ